MSPKRLCALAAVAIVIAIGGELNNFARRLMYVVRVGGILLGATLIVAGEGAQVGTQRHPQPFPYSPSPVAA